MTAILDIGTLEASDDLDALMAWEPWHYLESPAAPGAPSADADCYACGGSGTIKTPKGVTTCTICGGSGKR